MMRVSCRSTVARRLMLGAVALLIPALAGCEAGQDAPTLNFHPAANGASAVASNIVINNVFVLGGPDSTAVEPGSSTGLFIAMYNGGNTADKLVSVTAPGTAGTVSLPRGGVKLPAGVAVNLTGPTPRVVLTDLSTPLSGGQTIRVQLDFARAGIVNLAVPVEPQTGFYSGYATPSATASPTVTPSVSPGKHASPTATPTGTHG